MKNHLTFSRAVLMTSALTLASLNVQAQSADSGAPAPFPADPAAHSFDGYRALAVTAGVVGGAVAAGLLTGGVIMPLYCWATGGAGAGAGAGAGFMAGAGSGAAGAFHNVMTALGAVGGGFYADSLYRSQ